MQSTKQQRAWRTEHGVKLFKNTLDSKRHALCAMRSAIFWNFIDYQRLHPATR